MDNIKQYSGNFYSYFVQGFFALIIGAILPSIAGEYGLDYKMGGMLLAAHSCGSLVTNFSSGIIADYIGKKMTLIVFSFGIVVGFMLMTLTGNPIFLILAFFLTGVGRGSISNLNTAIVNDKSKSNVSVLSILNVFFAIGAFLSPIVVSLFLGYGVNWRYSSWLVVLLALIMIFIFMFMKIEKSHTNIKDKTEKEPRLFLKDTVFYISCALLFFYIGAESSVNGWLVTYLKDSGTVSTSNAQILLSVLWIVVMIGRLFCAYMAPKVGYKIILLASSGGLILFFTTFMFAHSILSVFITICGIGFCFAGVFPSTIANAGVVIRGNGLGMGILLSIGGVGGILMPYITGEVSQVAGIVGGMSAIGVAILLLFITAVSNIYVKRK